jgi:hypothetical protein
LKKNELLAEFKGWARDNAVTIPMDNGNRKVRDYLDSKYGNYETHKAWKGIRVKSMEEKEHVIATTAPSIVS